jgi:hypothetical protein
MVYERVTRLLMLMGRGEGREEERRGERREEVDMSLYRK